MTKHKKNLIKSRASTLRYEVCKTLSPAPRVLPPAEQKVRAHFLYLDGTCEYCRQHAAEQTDHFYACACNKQPTKFCNDEWNSVPACAQCNQSKGNKDPEVWIAATWPAELVRIKNYALLCRWYAQTKDPDAMKEFMDAVNTRISNFCSALQRDVDAYCASHMCSP